MSKLNLKLYFKKRKQRLSVFGASIQFDWRFIQAITFALLIVGMVYAGILYVRITNGSMFEIVEDENPKIQIEQKRADIRKVVEQLDAQSFDENPLN